MTTPTLSGLHHVTFRVTDLDDAIAWFETAFAAQHFVELDQLDESKSRVAVVLRIPGVMSMVGLRRVEDVSRLRDAGEASQQVEVALGVADRAELDSWAAHFGRHGVAHSDVLVGPLGSVLTCTMPGGPDLMLFTG